MELQNCTLLRRYRENRTLTLVTGAVFSGVYGLWVMFCMPGLRVPFRLKVPYLPSTSAQTQNVMKLLDGRRGRLADLGSGDGRLVFAACSSGFQCTGFEINSVLLAYSRGRAWWRGIPHTTATFINQDFWKMQDLEEKLMEELPDDGRVVVCRFPLPRWPHSSTRGAGLDQVWAYDVCTARHGTRTSSLKPQPKSDVAQ
uniref:Uncharacterized protein n=1 Tax=Astyanax mexicanus TaxID=7994 RepID=A0A3B1K5T4_ASTMX